MAAPDSGLSGSVLEALESRIKLLEDRVLGNDFNNSKGVGASGKLLETLSSVKQSVSGVATGKERINALWKRLEELNSSLDPDLADRLTLTENAKADIILAEEEQLKRQAALLEEMKAMTGTLDSEHTKGAPAFHDKLQPLIAVQLDQKEQADKQSLEVQQLLEKYNNIITLLSQQFIQWDAVMTRYEIVAKVRDPMEY